MKLILLSEDLTDLNSSKHKCSGKSCNGLIVNNRAVSLTTGLDRQKQLIDGAEGFIYAVAINGVTGKTGNYRDDLDKHLANLTAHADIPVLTGFGVSTEEDIKRFNAVSDGVIVGSKIVRDLHDGKEEEVAEFVTFGSHFEK